MTLMVAEKCAWSQGKVSKKLCGDLSLTLMGKTQKFSRGHYSGIVSDYRHAVEAVGESEGFLSRGHVGLEDCSAPKRRCMSLNADRGECFYVPRQVFSLSKMTGSEKKDLEMRLRRELDQVQQLQKKILLSNTVKLNGFVVPSSGDPLVKKKDHAVQKISQLKRGNIGRIENIKQVPPPPPITVLLKQCETLLKRLMAHQYAWVFNTPVDVEKLKIPDYFKIIKQPMDLGTVKSKVASGAYSSPLDFASDVRLTFTNAMTYNPPANDVHAMANAMNKFFEMRWKPIEKKAVAAGAALKRGTEAAKPPSESLKRKISQEDPVTVVLDSEPNMTDEEKLSLSRRLSSIPELPQHIVDFLKQHTHYANQDSEYEIEVDFDSLSIDALFELKKLMDDCYRTNHLRQPDKTEPCEIEVPNDSGLGNSSILPCKANGPVDEDEDEDVDIVGNDPLVTSYSHFNRGINSVPIVSNGSSSSNSSSESETSSSDSDSDSTLRSESNIKVGSSPNSTKENGQLQGAIRHIKEPVIGPHQSEQDAHIEAVSVKAYGNQEGENAPSERQVSPDKLYRAALLRSRFADTILKAREKTLDQGERRDPEKLRWEREELERQQREERARLQAEAKAAEEARRQAEADAAAEAKRQRELEREAARQALLLMEKTVDINESSLFLKDLEMLRAAADPIPGSAIERNLGSNEGIDGFNLSGSNPLEQLGLFMKDDDDDEEDDNDDGGGGVKLSSIPVTDAEEGEID